MRDNDYEDLLRYFRLIVYREEGSLLLEEYNELQDILNRCPSARILDDAYYNFLTGKISEEKYNSIYDYYFNRLEENRTKKLISD